MNHNRLLKKLPTVGLAAGLFAASMAGCSKEGSATATPSETPIAPPPSAAEKTPTHPQSATALKKLTLSKSAGKILFAGNTAKDAPHDLYEKDLRTGKVTNLTNTPNSDELNPQLSPNRHDAVYAGTDDVGNYQIYRINLASKHITRLTDESANNYDPAYVMSGPHKGDIFYKSNAADGYGDIWMKDSTTTNPGRDLTGAMKDSDGEPSEEWKPTDAGNGVVVFTSRHHDDGRGKAALSKTDELWSLDTTDDNAEPQRLTENTWADWYGEADPAHPGVIAFTSKDKADGPDTIYQMNVTQQEPYEHRKKLTNPHVLPGDSSDNSFAPDGTLLFVNNSSGAYGAVARTPDGAYHTLQTGLGEGGEVLSPIAVGDIEVG